MTGTSQTDALVRGSRCKKEKRKKKKNDAKKKMSEK